MWMFNRIFGHDEKVICTALLALRKYGHDSESAENESNKVAQSFVLLRLRQF
jgi:hypothetical protein